MLEKLIDNEQSKIKPYRSTLEANTLKQLQDMVRDTESMKLDKRLGKAKLIDYMISYFEEFGYPTNPLYKADPKMGLHRIREEVKIDPRPLHPILQNEKRDFRKEEEEELARNLEEKRKTEEYVARKSEQITVEQLDAIARAFQGQPKPTYDEAFPAKLIATCMTLVNLFDDGEDVIIQAKLGDQICRMFEKMRDNCVTAADKLKAELRTETRADLGTEINQNKIDDLEEKIARLRNQWLILNNAFAVCVNHLRPKVLGQTGINFGKYTTLQEMANLNKKKASNQRLTIANLVNDRENFDYHLHHRHEEIGLVEIPDGL
tara:strand:+ start:15251 stop:16207 length:957 start_codon:yes stop_codon:yes gene_type:complete